MDGKTSVNLARPKKINSHLAVLLERLNIDLVLDIGAHLGQYGTLLRELGYSRDIFSFEPVGSTYECLHQVCQKDDRWFASKYGLGSKPEKKMIHVTESSDFSSFYAPNEYGQKRFQQVIDVSHTELVEITTVDSFLETNIKPNRRNILLKMDTQGHDLEVFRGALKSLSSIVAIQSEIAFRPIYAGMPHYLDVLRVYEDYGFKVTGFYPISVDREKLVAIEMDCILVKDING